MKTILLPMIGYDIDPQHGIAFMFYGDWQCYTINTNLNTYPVADIPPNTSGSGGVR